MTVSGISSDEVPDPQLLASMPMLFKELANSIPVRTLLAFAEKFGGCEMYVPAKPNDASPFSAVLDPVSFKALTAARGRENIAIPRACAMRRLIRDRQIVEYRAAGHSSMEAAREFRLAQRTIHKIARRQASNAGLARTRQRGRSGDPHGALSERNA